MTFEIRRYRSTAGGEPFTEWLSDLVLLCGGDKRKQDADIRKAVELWQEYANRRRGEPQSKN